MDRLWEVIISDFRSSKAFGDHEVFRDKCSSGHLRPEVLERNVKEARGQGMDRGHSICESGGR